MKKKNKKQRQELTQDEIAARAYLIWERAGRPHGLDKDHWLQAVAESRAVGANGV